MKKKHTSLAYKQQAKPNKKYKELKQKQKTRIANWMYQAVFLYYYDRKSMPDKHSYDSLYHAVYEKIKGVAIWIPYEEFILEMHKKRQHYEQRVLRDIDNGMTPEQFAKKQKKTSREKAALRKSRKKKGKPMKDSESASEEVWQDDNFYYIAGYTSGGAPYGVTWEEMGMEMYSEPEEEDAFADVPSDKQMEWLDNYMAALDEMEE